MPTLPSFSSSLRLVPPHLTRAVPLQVSIYFRGVLLELTWNSPMGSICPTWGVLRFTCGFAAPSWRGEFQPVFRPFRPIWGVLLSDMGSIVVYLRKRLLLCLRVSSSFGVCRIHQQPIRENPLRPVGLHGFQSVVSSHISLAYGVRAFETRLSIYEASQPTRGRQASETPT